jgi:hypothetical protein
MGRISRDLPVEKKFLVEAGAQFSIPPYTHHPIHPISQDQDWWIFVTLGFGDEVSDPNPQSIIGDIRKTSDGIQAASRSQAVSASVIFTIRQK